MNRTEYIAQCAKNMEVFESMVTIKTPQAIYDYMGNHTSRETEVVSVVLLDGAHKVISIIDVASGILNRCLLHPREIFRPAIAANCASIIVMHNHPSGQLEFSVEDTDCGIRLRNAGEIVGIQLLDFMIYSKLGFKSMLEDNGL